MSRRRCTHKLRKIQNRQRNRAARSRAARWTEAALQHDSRMADLIASGAFGPIVGLRERRHQPFFDTLIKTT